MDANGNMSNSHDEIGQAFVNYFQKLFGSEAQGGMEDCLFTLSNRIIEDMNNELLQKFSMEEISGALNQMPPLKAPRPDGFTDCFYQENWASVGEEVCKVVLKFLNSGQLNNDLRNHFIYIALIPKVKKSYQC